MATGTANVPASPDMLALRLEDAPAAPVRRPRVVLIGTTLAAAASAAAFIPLFAAYFSVRTQHLADAETWLPDGATIPLSPGNMSMVTLAMSLVIVQWAVHAAANRDRQHAYLALGLTVLLGVAHVVQLAFLWTQWELPLNTEEPTYQAVLLFTIIGLHVAMVAAALIFIALMTVRSLGGQLTGRDAEGLSAAAMYWYVTVAVFTVIWYLLILK